MPATTVIDKRGDVILHVGEGKEDAVSLLVSSHVLGLASSVFEAMFEGRFAEGQNLSTTSPPTITFPDDHPKYMTFLCKLFHLQTDDIPGTLEISGLVELAVLCDKYDCAKGVRPWSKIWVSQHLSTPESHGFQQLLAVSFVLDLPHEFREVSVGLIRSYQHLDKTALAVNGHDYLPMVVIERLQMDHSRFQSQAAAAVIPQTITTILRSGCENCNTFIIWYFRSLNSAGLFPPRPMSLAKYLDGTRTFYLKESTWKQCNGACACFTIDKGKIKSSIFTEIFQMFHSVSGYCLDCINSQKSSNQDTSCRVPHG